MSKETVKAGWDALANGQTPTIVFAPTYNGVPDNIDAEKVLVNTSGYTGHMMINTGGSVWSESSGFPASQGSYSLYQGYGLVELPAALTSEKVRDMRSYLQTPMLSVKSLFSAISNPVSNNGYNVVLDDEFFSSGNPYYENAYITLPRITELNPENIEEELINVTVDGISGWSKDVTTIALGMDSSTGRKKDGLDITLNLTARLRDGSTANTLYTSCSIRDRDYKGLYYGGFACQILGIDSRGHEVAGSNIVWVTTELGTGDFKTMSEMTKFLGQDSFHYYDQVDNSIGIFNKSGNVYVWSKPLNFKILSTTEVRSYRLKIVPGAYSNKTSLLDYAGTLWEIIGTSPRYVDNYNAGPSFLDIDITAAYKLNNSVPGTYSGVKIYKEDLLNTKDTPADYLLSYCKLFNLYFDRDVTSKTIKILTSKNFYDRDVDLSDDIDRPIDIQPLSFEHKWYSFNYKQNKTESLDNYKAKYGVDFGSQRVNTGYEFDSETEELLVKNIFLNSAQVLEADKHYVKLTNNNCDVPTFLTDTVTYYLYNTSKETTEIKLMKAANTTSTDINGKSQELIKYDSFSKVQLHNQEKPSEGSNVLLFFNGMKETNVPYWITDDITPMIDLNEKPTWLYTASEYNTNGEQIAIRTTSVPQFSRYIEDENNIFASWDFGRTRELFIPEISYVDGDATIYERYWKAYINDLYDVDTRIVTAYIKFDEKPTKESLKHFYYFDNSYWAIDEVIDYNPTSYELTKVKFVKVNDKNHYRNENIVPPEPIPTDTISITAVTPIASTSTTLGYTVVSGDYCKVQIIGQTRINGHGPGTTSDILPIPENFSTASKYYTVKAWQTMDPSISAATVVEQEGAEEPISVTITSTSPIPATATSITYTVTADYAGTVKIDGGSLPGPIYNNFPAGSSTYTVTIPANTHSYVEYYGLEAKLNDYPSVTAATTVEQLGNEGPTLTSITLSSTWATDVPYTGGVATYQNCTNVVTAHYSDGTSADITSQSTFTASTTLNVPSTTSTTRENVGVINVIAAYYDGPNPFTSTVVVPVYQAAYVEPATFYFQNSDTTITVYGSFGIVRGTTTGYITGIEARPGMVEGRTDEVPFTITSVALAVSDPNVNQIVTSNSTTGQSIIATYDTSSNAWRGTGTIDVQQGTYIKFDLIRS